MTFKELAIYFKKLEETPSRNAMTEQLAELFKEAKADEIGKICYLLLGRVVPLYEALEFGMADKFVIRAIAKAYGADPVDVLKAFKRLGDLGAAAEEIQSTNKRIHESTNLGVKEVYEKLYAIAQMGGEGSQEKKIEALAYILTSVDAQSARYIVRIPLDKLRLGFSDMTILDALSYLLAGDKSMRVTLEAAYNVRPDLGYLAETVKKEGIAGLAHVHMKVGAPILAALCQRLPTADEMVEKMGEVSVEPKYDGMRCVGGYTGLFIKDRGYISARDVREGDFVLTHKGRFKKIVAVARRYPKPGENLYKLQTMLGDPCIVSGDHPVLRHHKEGSQWIPVRDLSVSDWLLFPKIQTPSKKIPSQLVLRDDAGYSKSIAMSEEFFRFLGFWIGDGFSNNSHQSERVGLTFNAKIEKALAKEYEQIIKKTLHIKDVSSNERNGGLNLCWRDSLFRIWLTHEFRYQEENGDHGKCIPEWMFGMTRKQFFAFIQGWIEADGTPRHGEGSRVTTKEHRLAHMAVLLGSVFRYPIGVRKIRIALQGLIVKTYYELLIPGTNRYVKELSDGYVVKIRTLEEAKVDKRVYLYDFQVEDDESFCTSLAAMHNCQIHYRKGEVKTFSRNLENTTEMFPELQDIGNQIHGDEVILDAEAVGVDAKGNISSFQQTMTRKRKHDIAASSTNVPLKFYVFDVLYSHDKELLSMPLKDRKDILDKIVNKGKLLEIAPHIVTSSPQEIREYHEVQIARGLEGIVVKKWDSPYEPGRRGFSWVKLKEEEGKAGKLTDTIDAVIMGYTRGEGKRTAFGVGQMLLGVRRGEEFVTVTKLGTGTTEAELSDLHKKLTVLAAKEQPKEYVGVAKNYTPDVWVTPSIVLEIAGDDLTISPTHGAGYAVRFPRLVRIRTDRRPENITTVKELEQMYRNQSSQNTGR